MGELVEAGPVDLAHAAVITVDLAGNITAASPFVEQLYGWTPEDLVGRRASDFAAIAVDPDVTQEITAAIVNGGSWEGTFSVRRKNGTSISVRVIDLPLFDSSGKLAGILSVAFDASGEQELARRLDQQTRSAQVFEFLAECTTALSSALTYEQALQSLARVSADFLGDICLIDVMEGGTLRRMGAAHRDRSRQALVDALIPFLPDPTGEHPAVKAITSGASAFSATMSEDFLRRTTRNEDHLRLVLELGFQSFICVPLTARGRTLGAITIVSCAGGDRLTAEDVDVAQELAWRAALALDNARQSEERGRVARVLQASLLPPSLPDIQGVTLAARYVAAEQVLEVGGDFYDVFDAGYRAWALSIGDVCGRGPRAAALTGLIRHTLRSLALRERNPASMLASLNAVLHRDLDDPGLFCTVLYGILRQRADGLVLRYANAGHPPPMLLSTNGRITERHEGGLVLGPFPSGTWTTETVKLRPSDTVVFYTDGVSEARRGDEQFGDEALRTTLAAFAGADAETIAAGLTDAAAAFAEGAVPDDMAVLVVQATTTV